jgi:hypothetical protein
MPQHWHVRGKNELNMRYLRSYFTKKYSEKFFENEKYVSILGMRSK